MRRKIIRQGNKSYTLTLPIDWIRDENLESGDEVSIKMEDDNSLLISKSSLEKTGSSCTVDVTGLTRRVIINIINNMYRKGYDQIKLTGVERKDEDFVNGIVRQTLLGFELVHIREGAGIIENIAEPSVDKYEQVLRKLFQIIEYESKVILNALLKGDLTLLDERDNVKDMVDTYTNLCRRLVIKHKLEGQKNSPLVMVIISRLSLIHHGYHYLYSAACKHKKYVLPKSLKNLFEDTNKTFALLHQSFFKRDVKKASEAHMLTDRLCFKDLLKVPHNANKTDVAVVIYLREIARLVHTSSTVVLGMIEN